MKVVRENTLVVKLSKVEVKGMIAAAIARKLRKDLSFVKLIDIHQDSDGSWFFKQESIDLDE